MEYYTFDKKNGLWYKLEGDYYIPCVTVPEVQLTGIWGERRRHFLKDQQKALYIGMMLDDEYMTNYTSMEQLPITLSANQVAQVLGISRANAYTLMHSKGFPTIQIGKRMVVPKNKLIEWMERQTTS